MAVTFETHRSRLHLAAGLFGAILALSTAPVALCLMLALAGAIATAFPLLLGPRRPFAWLSRDNWVMYRATWSGRSNLPKEQIRLGIASLALTSFAICVFSYVICAELSARLTQWPTRAPAPWVSIALGLVLLGLNQMRRRWAAHLKS
ncbi:MAG: hypothetical protein AB8B51_22060 [Sedimentitalea sp.]